jgi:hypothetical protein
MEELDAAVAVAEAVSQFDSSSVVEGDIKVREDTGGV